MSRSTVEVCRVSLSEQKKTSAVGSGDVTDSRDLIVDRKSEIMKDSADSDGVRTRR